MLPPRLPRSSRIGWGRLDQVLLDPEMELKLRAMHAIGESEGWEVVEDRSPVMGSPDAYLARADHGSGRIELNGRYLDQLPESNREQERRFLVAHEAYHLLVRRNPGLALGQDEEEAADLLGLYALQNS